MIAEILQGHAEFADVMFLVAFILAVLAGAVSFRPVADARAGLGWFAVAAVALGFLAL